ncbi:response regulator [Microvirga sp. M2]|uniref:response regulator n=1 Tax=Microvirga sp. M2 TaxID=3073270 RepID=UPI0039C303CA
MDTSHCDCILVVDTNLVFREALCRWLRAIGCKVRTADTGEQAFLILRDWQQPIDWLYARADLPMLIDGWILADEYHDSHPTRPAVIAAPEARSSDRGDIIILVQPNPAVVLEVLHGLVAASRRRPNGGEDGSDYQRHAA